MLTRFRSYEQQAFCFLTTMPDPTVDITAELEPIHPLLKRPRIVVTCPPGTKVPDIKAVFTKRGWDGALYEAWWVKNGRYLVKIGALNEC